MFFKLTGQAFLIPATIFALGFFIVYTSSKIENKVENKGIKLYAFFTVALLWVSAAFLLIGGILGPDIIPPSMEEEEIPEMPMPPGEEGIGPHQDIPSFPNGDEEMSLNPDEGMEESPSVGLEAGKCPFLEFHRKGKGRVTSPAALPAKIPEEI